MLYLQENEICQYKKICPYNKTDSCMGARADRKYKFKCSYVDNDGVFVEGQPLRLSQDQTGQMRVIMEKNYATNHTRSSRREN